VNGAELPHCSATGVESDRTSVSAESVAGIGAGLCTVTDPLTAQALSSAVADALMTKPTFANEPCSMVIVPVALAVFVSDHCQSRVYDVVAVLATESAQTFVAQLEVSRAV
jgi:alpha-D-ribose 1-methylphosphonate 5-triphosphate synthase subunit PhnG